MESPSNKLDIEAEISQQPNEEQKHADDSSNTHDSRILVSETVSLAKPPKSLDELTKEIDAFKLHAFFSKDFRVKKTVVKLTPPEIKARKMWNDERAKFIMDNEEHATENLIPRKVASAKELLSCVIIPPHFTPHYASCRSKHTEQRSKRHYPQKLEQWAPEFTSDHFASEELLQSPPTNPLMRSFLYDVVVTNETEEEAFLKYVLWRPCVLAGLMYDEHRVADETIGVNVPIVSTIIGLPDNANYAGGGTDTAGKLTIVIECKSSQNLLIPNEFDDLKNTYEGAVNDQTRNQKKERSKNWSQVCHPLGQLFAYMLDNGVRFGALCSASKTYFVFFDGQGDDIGTVRITEAFFTSQRGFLHAWASFADKARHTHYTSREKNSFRLPNAWLESTPIDGDNEEECERVEIHISTRGPDRDDHNGRGGPGGRSRRAGNEGRAGSVDRSGSRGGASRGAGKRTRSRKGKPQGDNKKSRPEKPRHCSTATELADSESDVPGLRNSSPESMALEDVIPRDFPFHTNLFDFEEDFVDFYDPPDFKIGKVLGSGRNGHVFLSDFKGEEVAVKQFDLSKNFDGYQREIEGYKFLKGAWGELVPEPKFIGASRSGMVRFLGLQKGMIPEVDDDDVEQFEEQYAEVLKKLSNVYHFEHLDLEYGRNVIYVQEGTAPKKLLLVDLESWEDTTRDMEKPHD